MRKNFVPWMSRFDRASKAGGHANHVGQVGQLWSVSCRKFVPSHPSHILGSPRQQLSFGSHPMCCSELGVGLTVKPSIWHFLLSAHPSNPPALLASFCDPAQRISHHGQSDLYSQHRSSEILSGAHHECSGSSSSSVARRAWVKRNPAAS